jgi:DNA ligase-1
MLACSESAHHFFDKLRFPLLASPKIDGIRATVRGGVVYARSNEPLRNKNVQAKFKHLEYFDGEMAYGDPTAHDLCRVTGGITNSIEKPVDELKFYVFDRVEHLTRPYWQRNPMNLKLGDNVVIVKQHTIRDLKVLLEIEEYYLDLGYEGLILRDPDAPYKCGRGTAKEQCLLKLKRFEDAEAEVIGFEERMHNGNEATTSALGRTKRSSHQGNKTGRGDLGALLLRRPDGVEFRCGTGFDDAERAEIWNNQKRYLGKLWKYRFFAVGMKDKPRHSVSLGERLRSDLS